MSQEASAQICRPVAERTAELGCWIFEWSARNPEQAWQLDIPTRAAADVAKTPSGTVVEALGKTWLLTIGDAGWKQADRRGTHRREVESVAKADALGGEMRSGDAWRLWSLDVDG